VLTLVGALSLLAGVKASAFYILSVMLHIATLKLVDGLNCGSAHSR